MPRSHRFTRITVAAMAEAMIAFMPTTASAQSEQSSTPPGMQIISDSSHETMGAPFKMYKLKNKKKITSNYVSTNQILAKCQSSGGHCTIDSTRSATRTINLSLGVTRKWVATQLSISSASSVSLSISCTSPKLKKNQTWKAYPLGSRWSYKIQSQLYGSDDYGRSWPVGKPSTSGTRYAFNPTGISCRR